VKLSHDCYEEINFKAGIVKGKSETFDLAQHLKIKTGVLVLDAQKDGEPVSETVFLNGSPAGQTPFNGEVPVCSEITIGDSRNKVDVNLAHNQTVQYKYVFPVAAQPKENTSSLHASRFKQQAKPHEAPPPHKTSPGVITLRVAGAAAGGIGIIGGLVVNGGIQDVYDKYPGAQNASQVEKVKGDIDGKVALRNAMYAIAGVGLCGFTVALFF
jgi:hypothetical protein